MARRSSLSGDAIGQRLLRTTLVTVAFVVVMAPWWIHNARVHGRFIPLDTTGGYNLLIGNGPYATGQWHWNEVSRLHADLLRSIDVTTPAGSSAAVRMAVAHVRAHPVATVALAPTKVAALFAVEGREHMTLYSSVYFGPFSSAAVLGCGVITMAAFPLLLTMAIAGRAVRGGVDARVTYRCADFVIAAMLPQVLTFGDARYHLPLVPVFTVFSTGLSSSRHGFDWRRLLAGALLLLWLSGPWSRQISAYTAALTRMTASDGWQSPLPFIDLR